MWRFRAAIAFSVLLVALLARGDDPAGTQPSAKSAQESIVVTAHPPGPLGDTAEDVRVVSRFDLQTTAGPAVDDALRQVPGFTLFRRTGSRAANPTSQGVSLRGIGASGASRALVLDDGIPLNDPFGGWIYWGRVTSVALERVEVLRGGASDLYGSGAMGGVIDFVRRDRGLQGDDVAFDASAGGQGTRTTSLFAAVAHGEWSGSVAADLFRTDGYVLVVPSQRGTVDIAAATRHTSLDATLRRGVAFVRASSYAEERENGTPLQTNDTHLEQLAAGIDTPVAVRAYILRQRYHQTFSAIAANRNSERLTVDQRVPARGNGGSLDWRPSPAPTLLAFLGAEVRNASGASDELGFAANGGVTPSRAEGHQRTTAGHAMLMWQSQRLSITGGARFDSWRNDDAKQNGVVLPSRSDTAWSPRLTALYELAHGLSVTASAYSAFRAPTLNELYRGFRVGNVLTLPNAQLGSERLTGVEGGVRGYGARVTLFDMRVSDTIANVTTATTPSLITRQRQNLGSSRSRGIEAEWSRTLRATTFTAGYLLADATLSTGRRTPQVPRHQATLQVTQHLAATMLGAQTRWSSPQFDDDLNELPLRSAFVADLFASHGVARNLEVTLAIENVFDKRVEASASPVITIGQPRALRVGVRYALRK